MCQFWGTFHTSKIIYATGLHKQFVYTALARLEEKGLVRHVIQRGRKKFSATTPQRLVALAEEGKIRANTLSKKLQTRFVHAHERDFEVVQGESAFVGQQLAMMERMPIGSRIDVISGPNDKYFSLLNDEGAGDEFEQLRIKKDITVRYLGAPSERAQLLAMEKWREKWTYRIFPGLSTGLVDMGIWPNAIVLNVFGSPLLSFTISGNEIEKGYREFFEAVWNLSER